jgi:plastocyanin
MSSMTQGEASRARATATAIGAAIIVTIASFVAYAAPPVRKPVTHTVIVDAASFSPSELTVAVGDSIVWVNRDILAHTATTTADAKIKFDSKVIEPGKSWKYTAKRRGAFPYTCAFHPMNGKLTVK